MSAFRDPADFDFVPRLEAAYPALRAELARLDPTRFPESPDSLTTVRDGFDETGWRWLGLFGEGPELAANRRRSPEAARACAAVPELVNAGWSVLLPGTHLYPHRGELEGVLRCHLAVRVPEGDAALRLADEARRWRAGRCLVFDDTVEHEAWNRGERERVVLLVTFRAPGAT